MSQADAVPTEFHYTATIEPQIAFPCSYGEHDGHPYQDWYVPAVLLTGTLLDSSRDPGPLPFSSQGPAYIRIYPTAHLNKLRHDAIAADFRVPTPSAKHVAPRDATPFFIPNLELPTSPSYSPLSTPSPTWREVHGSTTHREDTPSDCAHETDCTNCDQLPPASLLFATARDEEGSGSNSDAEDEWDRVVNSPEYRLLTASSCSNDEHNAIHERIRARYDGLVSRHPGFYDNISPDSAVTIADCIDRFYPDDHPSRHGFPPSSSNLSPLASLPARPSLPSPTMHYSTLSHTLPRLVPPPSPPLILAPIPISLYDASPILIFQDACERVLDNSATGNNPEYELDEPLLKSEDLDRLYDDLEAGRCTSGDHTPVEHIPMKRNHLEIEQERWQEHQDDSIGQPSVKRSRRDLERMEPHVKNEPDRPSDAHAMQVPLLSHDASANDHSLCLPPTATFHPLPPLLLSFYTAPADTNISEDDYDYKQHSHSPSTTHSPSVSRSTTPSTPATTPEPVRLNQQQQDEYDRLFQGGAVRDFVERVLLDAMQDATDDMCEFFQDEFEIFRSG
ncbi:hypothetical protein K466DRAFT_606130 [Polyporus arcularius HHB13444]|uniref:Uncharacterized protein n=1 Tax=Polyporus arcularius HHB13444 TaxID=1314778 RepID=A0A5C3NQ61_9APHY|nr:hypothetical protein K466DRAFT_606130 [Polyporus arcularius HHB13444]